MALQLAAGVNRPSARCHRARGTADVRGHAIRPTIDKTDLERRAEINHALEVGLSTTKLAASDLFHRELDKVEPALVKAVAVEFMAQAMFNFMSCNAVAVATQLAGDNPVLKPLQVATFHFALLYILIGGTKDISGGHFNPIISILFAYWGDITVGTMFLYIAAQMTGAAVGSGLQFFLLPASLQDIVHAGAAVIPADHTVPQAFVAEMAASFVLNFVICMYGLDPRGDRQKIPLVMSLTIMTLIWTIGPISGMCINPARAFGPALATGYWENWWVWWTAPLLGGFLAIAPYKFLLQLEQRHAAKRLR